MFKSLLIKLRSKTFWWLDHLSGGEIIKVCLELKKIEKLGSGSEELIAYQNRALLNLLKHAAENTKYYSKYNKAVMKLCDLPVVDKQVIRDNQDCFISEAFQKVRLTMMSTSGSTGVPFTVYQDRAKKKRVNAEIIYYSEKVGYRVGCKLLNLRAVVDKNRKPLLQQWLQNIWQIDVSMIDDEDIRHLMIKIEKASGNGSLLLAYASTYDALHNYFIKNGINNKCKIVGAVSSSEMLSDDTREKIEEAFKCKCVSRYSNQENGVIGQDDQDNNVFIINEAHYLVEVLELDADLTAGEGEVGRIVVTDLYNYAMPMIRYDTGDLASIKYVTQNNVVKKALANFGGRRLDMVYDSRGKLISPHKLSVTFWGYNELKQFQFIQEGKYIYRVILNLKGSFDREKDLKNKLMKLLGTNARIEFEYVNDIPVLDSGKRKYIINKTLTQKG